MSFLRNLHGISDNFSLKRACLENGLDIDNTSVNFPIVNSNNADIRYLPESYPDSQLHFSELLQQAVKTIEKQQNWELEDFYYYYDSTDGKVVTGNNLETLLNEIESLKSRHALMGGIFCFSAEEGNKKYFVRLVCEATYDFSLRLIHG